MSTLFLRFQDDFDKEIEISQIKGEDLLECLQKLHEQLDGVAKPGKYVASFHGVSFGESENNPTVSG